MDLKKSRQKKKFITIMKFMNNVVIAQASQSIIDVVVKFCFLKCYYFFMRFSGEIPAEDPDANNTRR